MDGLEEQMERRVDEAAQYQIAAQQDAAFWDRRYVSSLIDVAHEYVERGEMDLAQQFVEEAKRYDNGTYKRFIEAAELHLEIGRAFAEYDREQAQKQEYAA
ncbi:hypothetical protein HZA99_05740 [Candidatus Woesearchaeota archaeon]|nr:hypothetical protein [Candidatus Woesearchaeota archaeon]